MRVTSFLIGLFLATGAMAQDWQAVERVEPYSVQGTTGLEIYRSIGERGPQLGVARVLAPTGFKLTWKRKYERQGNAPSLLHISEPPRPS